MHRLLSGSALALALAGLAGCGPNYSPNTYSSTAVQQANKVETGVIVGVRRVDIAAPGTTGAVAGAAAGGIAGTAATQGASSVSTALTALGGGLVGGILGTEAEHKLNDTWGYEYIVRKANDEMVSVTQKDDTPLGIGLHVLVIAGPQARIVADYTVPIEPEKAATSDKGAVKSDAKPEAKVETTIRLAPDAPAGKATLEPAPAPLSAAKTEPPTDAPIAVAPLAPPADKPAPSGDTPTGAAAPSTAAAPAPDAAPIAIAAPSPDKPAVDKPAEGPGAPPTAAAADKPALPAEPVQ